MPKKAMENLTESMFYVLLALQQKAMCGIDIVTYVETLTQERVCMGPATLYTILGKFEKEKYIRETAVDGRKRTYEITEKGQSAYQEELQRLKHCVADALKKDGKEE